MRRPGFGEHHLTRDTARIAGGVLVGVLLLGLGRALRHFDDNLAEL